MAGYLHVRKNGAWRKLFVLLDPPQRKITLYRDDTRKTQVDCFTVVASTKVVDAGVENPKPNANANANGNEDAPKYVFHLVNGRSQKLVCAADSESEQKQWLSIVTQVIPGRKANQGLSPAPGGIGIGVGDGPGMPGIGGKSKSVNPNEAKINDIVQSIAALQRTLVEKRHVEDQKHKDQVTNDMHSFILILARNRILADSSSPRQ